MYSKEALLFLFHSWFSQPQRSGITIAPAGRHPNNRTSATLGAHTSTSLGVQSAALGVHSAALGVHSTTSSFPSARGRRRRGWVPRLCSTCTQPRSKYRRVGTLNSNSNMTKVTEIDVYNNSKILNHKPIPDSMVELGEVR